MLSHPTPSETHPAMEATRRWVKDVVIGLQFCPFAARPYAEDRIRYALPSASDTAAILESLIREVYLMDQDEQVETTLLLLPDSHADFFDYLDLVDLAEALLADQQYEGIYQLASFHPAYQFAGNSPEDPANYTNRSPVPMLHIIREDSITAAVDRYPDPEGIPDRNRVVARNKGLAAMQALRAACWHPREDTSGQIR